MKRDLNAIGDGVPGADDAILASGVAGNVDDVDSAIVVEISAEG